MSTHQCLPQRAVEHRNGRNQYSPSVCPSLESTDVLCTYTDIMLRCISGVIRIANFNRQTHLNINGEQMFGMVQIQIGLRK